MKYEAYYAEIDQRTERFLWKFGFTEWTWIPYSLTRFVPHDFLTKFNRCESTIPCVYTREGFPILYSALLS